jgi:predicted RNA binding protein YcfA (HicA-like mRNA interferase family)
MSGRLPSLKPDKVIRILERNGFWRITGRKKHRIYTDGEHIVPVPNGINLRRFPSTWGKWGVT